MAGSKCKGDKCGSAGRGPDEYVVRATAADRARAARMVQVRRVRGKGLGVFAARDLPAFTMVAPYTGQRFSDRHQDRRRAAGVTDSTFAAAFWRPDANSVARTGYVVDPGDGSGKLLPKFRKDVAPLVNEPGPSGAPNLVWVWNLPRYRLEHWTARRVSAGEELTLCYGTGGGYERSYATSCVTRAGEVEPELHVLVRSGQRPVPYSSLGNAGVRAALLALAMA